MRIKRLIPVFIVSLLVFQAPSWAAVYSVDPDHTTVSFKIKHLFSNVQGQFTKFEGTMEYDADKPDSWKASGQIDAASINTNVEQRDKHLRSKDFFDVEQFPKIAFAMMKVLEVSKDAAKIEGTITIHGVTKPIVLDVKIHGAGKDPWGNVRAGFTAIGKLNRKDFGLNWNQALETGGVLVGDEVEITLEIEGILKE